MQQSIICGNITHCPNRNCKAKFYLDCHLGWIPGRGSLEVFSILRCPSCRDTFKISQMLHMAHEYKDSLPKREVKPNKITIFTDQDQESFRQELYSEANPLFILYDGGYPTEQNLNKNV